MDRTIPDADRSELAAAFFQATVTLGLALLWVWLYRRYGKRYFGWWALAWVIYVLRLGVRARCRQVRRPTRAAPCSVAFFPARRYC